MTGLSWSQLNRHFFHDFSEIVVDDQLCILIQ